MIYTQPNKGTFKIAIAGSTVTGKSIAENLSLRMYQRLRTQRLQT